MLRQAAIADLKSNINEAVTLGYVYRLLYPETTTHYSTPTYGGLVYNWWCSELYHCT